MKIYQYYKKASIPNILLNNKMKPSAGNKVSRNISIQSDDENVRYKINTKYSNSNNRSSPRSKAVLDDDNSVRYKLPPVLSKPKHVQKPKSKPKIKVNFWSHKRSTRLNNDKQKTNKINESNQNTVESRLKTTTAKVRKQVSFLPSPLFLDNHIPMVTVPDDLTIHLNEEEANDLAHDLNEELLNSHTDNTNRPNTTVRTSLPQNCQSESKRKQSNENSHSQAPQGNENELEFFQNMLSKS